MKHKESEKPEKPEKPDSLKDKIRRKLQESSEKRKREYDFLRQLSDEINGMMSPSITIDKAPTDLRECNFNH